MASQRSEIKFALVSHVLPPAPSGQAIVLSRLLRDLDPNQYCLISACDEGNFNERATTRLPGRYFSLGADPVLRLSGSIRTLSKLTRNYYFKFRHSGPTVSVGDATLVGESQARQWGRQLTAHGLSLVPWVEDRLHLRRQVFQRAARIRRVVASERCQALVACSGDLIDLPAACVAARWANIPFYAYMFDDYATNSSSHVHREFSRDMMKLLMRKAAGIVVPNEFLASTYRTLYGVAPWIIPNPVDAETNRLETDWKMRSPGHIVYTGAVYDAHFDAFHRLIWALSLMKNSAPELHIYTSSDKQYLRNHRIGEPAIIHEAVPMEASMQLQRDADIVFLPLAFDSPISSTIHTSAPGKMGELLASGRPVLVHAPRGSFVSWYFRAHQCGEVVDEKDPEQLCRAIERLRHNPEHARALVARAKERARCDFALPVARERFLQMLESPAPSLAA